MYVMVPLDIAIPSISYGLRPSPNLVVKSNFSPWPMRKIGYGCTNMSHKQNSIINNPDVFHDIPTCVTCKFWFWCILIYCPCNMLQDEPSPVISWFINSLTILISFRIPTKLCASTWLSSWPHQNYPLQKICILRVKESPSHSDFEELQVIGSFQLSGNQEKYENVFPAWHCILHSILIVFQQDDIH